MTTEQAIEKFLSEGYTPGKQIKSLPSGNTIAARGNLKLLASFPNMFAKNPKTTFRVINKHDNGGFSIHKL